MRVRSDWHNYFMQMAHLVSTRATCDRKHVGAVIVRDRRVVATGYNGSAPGMPHCDDVGHDLVMSMNPSASTAQATHSNCVRTIHAEVNAIAQAARFGIGLEGASLYCNTFPCWPCFKLVAASGIKSVYYDDEYRNDYRVIDCSKAAGIALIGPQAWKPGVPL